MRAGRVAVREVVRGLLLDSDHLDIKAEVLLFAAQRRSRLRGGPTRAEGEWVISDRTYYSSLAYQGRARGVGMGLGT